MYHGACLLKFARDSTGRKKLSRAIEFFEPRNIYIRNDIFQNFVVPDVRRHGTRDGLHGLQQLSGIYGESVVHQRRNRILSDTRIEFPG